MPDSRHMGAVTTGVPMKTCIQSMTSTTRDQVRMSVEGMVMPATVSMQEDRAEMKGESARMDARCRQAASAATVLNPTKAKVVVKAHRMGDNRHQEQKSLVRTSLLETTVQKRK